MGFKLKQENYNKPVTAEAIKVLLIIADYEGGGLRLPGMLPNGVLVGTENIAITRFYGSGHAPGLRCRLSHCFCTMTRLHANLVIKHIIRSSPSKKAALMEWRRQREAARQQRRVNRNVAASYGEPLSPIAQTLGDGTGRVVMLPIRRRE